MLNRTDVQAGQPLFSIVNLEDIWVTANFKETQLQDMQSGEKVEIEVDAYGRNLKARLNPLREHRGALQPVAAENATGNYVKVVQRIPVRICI